MKIPTILIFILFSFFACNKKKDPNPVPKDEVVLEDEIPDDEDEEEEIIDSTRYIIKDKGCDNNVQTYGGCYNSLALKNDTAWIMFSDMILILDYYYSSDTLILNEYDEGKRDVFKFLVLHPDTLKMTPSNDLWIKRRK